VSRSAPFWLAAKRSSRVAQPTIVVYSTRQVDEDAVGSGIADRLEVEQPPVSLTLPTAAPAR
jgi:hypothetical protein